MTANPSGEIHSESNCTAEATSARRSDDLFHMTVAACTAVTLMISLLGYLFCNLKLSLSQATPLGLMMILLLVVAAQYRWRKEYSCFSVVIMSFWLIGVTNFHYFPMYMAAGRDVPMSDAALAAMDRAIGVEVPTVLEMLKPYPALNAIMLSVYKSLIPLMTLAIILPPLLRRTERAKEFVLGCVVAAAISMPIFACFQAVGPWHYYDFEPVIPSLAGKEAMLATLKTKAEFVIDVSNRDGLITFPSFHVILTVLAAVALWPFRYLRWFTTLWAALIVVSTVTTGIHYTIDVLGGLGVAYVSWRCARAYLQWLQSRAKLSRLAPVVGFGYRPTSATRA